MALDLNLGLLDRLKVTQLAAVSDTYIFNFIMVLPPMYLKGSLDMGS
jgi:hypothetical protein